MGVGIDGQGIIAGSDSDAATVSHGLVRTPDGNIMVFDAPGSGTGTYQGTAAFGINPAGTITGNRLDINNVFHGFVRSLNGTLTTFDAPGAGAGAGQGTSLICASKCKYISPPAPKQLGEALSRGICMLPLTFYRNLVHSCRIPRGKSCGPKD